MGKTPIEHHAWKITLPGDRSVVGGFDENGDVRLEWDRLIRSTKSRAAKVKTTRVRLSPDAAAATLAMLAKVLEAKP